MNPQEDDKLRQIWLSSQKEAPAGFADFIMQQLPEQTPLPAELKKPLLSPRILWSLGSLLALLVIGGSFMGDSSNLPAPAWQHTLQQWLGSGISVLESTPGILPLLAMLSVAVMLLTGLDRLLKQLLLKNT